MQLSKAVEAFDLAFVGINAAKTRCWYRQRLAPLLDYFGPECSVDTITIEQLWRWRATLADQNQRWSTHPGRPTAAGPLSPHTLHGHVRAARRLFAWLHERDYLLHNPARALKLPKLPRNPPKAIADKDLEKMLRVALKSSVRDYALLRFLIDTGCRAGGVASLTLTNLELDLCLATVYEKGEKSREVYFLPETAAALRRWLLIRPRHKGEHVFIGLRGALTVTGIYQVLKRLAKAGGVRGRFNPHSLRHHFAREWLRKGGDLTMLSQVLGHSTIDVTANFYARWAGHELQNAHLRYSPLAAAGGY